MKYKKSQDGEERATVRVNVRLTRSQVEYLTELARTERRSGFWAVLHDAVWVGVDWDSDTVKDGKEI